MGYNAGMVPRNLSGRHRMARRLTGFFRWMLAASAVAGLLAAAAPARAQAVTELSVSPSAVEISKDGQAALYIMVSDVEDLDAFDIELTYNPAIVSLISWGFGSFLTQLTQDVLENEPGRFHLAAAQQAQPGKSGSGSLIELSFTGLSQGESAITLTKGELADPQGALGYPNLRGGVVRVNASTAPASTQTQAPTLTQTLTPTRTPTRTPTPPAGGAYPTGAPPSNTPDSGGGLPILTEVPEPTGSPSEQSPMPTRSVTQTLAGTLELHQPADPLALVPGAEKTRQAGHYGTLMAQVAQMTASSKELSASEKTGNLSFTTLMLWALLAAGLIVLGVLVVLIIRRANAQKNFRDE